MIKNKKFIYICAPYRGKDQWHVLENIRNACKWGKYAYKIGLIPIIPHINSEAIFGNAGDDKKITEFDLQLLLKCDLMWACSAKISKGMQKEINFCTKHHIPVVYKGSIKITRLDL